MLSTSAGAFTGSEEYGKLNGELLPEERKKVFEPETVPGFSVLVQ